MRLVLAVVALVGCDKVFNLDPITPLVPPPDAPPDAPPIVIHGRLFERYATNTAGFVPAVVDNYVLPQGSFGLVAKLDDGAYAPVTYNSDGTFFFQLDRPGQRYHLISNAIGEIESTAPVLSIASMVGGRPDRRPIATALLNFTFPTPVGAQTGSYILSTGQYSDTYTYSTASTQTWNWLSSFPTGGVPLGMLDASKYDALYVLQFETDYALPPWPAYTAIHALSQTSLSLEPGGSYTLPTPTTRAFDTCVSFKVDDATEYSRLVTASPPRTYQAYYSWNIFWVPSADLLGTAAAINIADTAAYAPPMAGTVTPQFVQPFPGGNLVVADAVIAWFDALAPGATNPYRLGNLSERIQKISAEPLNNCFAGQVSDLSGHTAIADVATLDGTRLATANQPVSVTNGEVVVTTSAPGTIHTIGVVLYELIAVGSDTQPQAIKGIVSPDLLVHFDPLLFQHGHTYMILVTTRMNQPNAAAGDYATLSFPLELMQTWSLPFVAQ